MATKQQFRNFEELLTGSTLPIVVDFYADWCGPCHMMSQILEQVSKQLKGQVQVVKINTENYPNLASRYHIYALPTLIVFKEGEPTDRIEGVLSTDQLVARLKGLGI